LGEIEVVENEKMRDQTLPPSTSSPMIRHAAVLSVRLLRSLAAADAAESDMVFDLVGAAEE